MHKSKETLSYTDTSAICDHTYYYVVQAVLNTNSHSYSSFSNVSASGSWTCPSDNGGGAATTELSTTPYSDTGDSITTPFDLGSQVHDSATVSATGTTPEGHVNFSFYSGGTCADQSGATHITTMDESTHETSGSVDSTIDSDALHAGNYFYLVSFTSDDNLTWTDVAAQCEDVTVNKADAVVTTELHVDPDGTVPTVVTAPPGTEPLGTTVHDSVTVAKDADVPAAWDAPTGSVAFTFYGNNTKGSTGSNTGDCTDTTNAGAGTGNITSSSSTADPSTAEGPLHAGNFAFDATFTPDTATAADYNITTSPCEPFSIAMGDATFSTTPHSDASDLVSSPFALGATVHDSATVVGNGDSGFEPTGTVSFDFYGDNSYGNTGTGDCSETPVGAGSADVNSSGTPTNSATVDGTGVGPMHAGSYGFTADYTGDADYNTITADPTTDCETFSVNKGTPTITTAIHTGATDGTTPVVLSGSAALGSQVHDSASVTGDSSGFTPSGNVTFAFWGDNSKNNTSTGTCASPNVSHSLNTISLASGVADPSTASGALHAGSYAYQATYNGDADYSSKTSDCEPFSAATAGTSTTTTLKDSSGNTLGSYVISGTTVHDTSTTTSTNASFPVGGTTTFKFWTNGNCSSSYSTTDTENESSTTNGTGTATETTTHTLNTIGSYCWNAHYNGDGDYTGSQSANEPLTVVPASQVTNSSLCTFDTDTGQSGRQFNLIYTPDVGAPTYKLNASNPGQFYYNAFYVGAGNTNIVLNVPAPFLTQGAVPVHVYTGVTLSNVAGQTCFTPGTDITSSSTVSTSGSNSTTGVITGTSGGTVTVHLPSLTTLGGFAYINIHLDYGYKGYDNCTKDATTLKATCTTPLSATISNLATYTFTSTNDTTGSSVQNENIFKKDPGIGGLVTKSSNPVSGAVVNIYDGSNHLLGTVTTDQDGWYMWAYKYSGKAATFVVKTGTLSQTVTLKSNGYLIVNFTT